MKSIKSIVQRLFDILMFEVYSAVKYILFVVDDMSG